MKTYRTIIIDDESRAREAIKDMLSLYCEGIEVIGEAGNVAGGIKLIDKLRPDIVLLDIQMPDGTGFDLLEGLDQQDFSLVFITAFDEYAIKAFKFSATDYLLKPIDPDELILTIKRVKEDILNERNGLSEVLSTLRDFNNGNKKLVLKTAESIYIKSIQDIIRCESSGNYTLFHFSDQKPLLVSQTLKEYEEMLKEHQFIRIHQSHLVNLEHIVRYDRLNGGMLIMSDNKSVPVSVRKKESLMSVFGLR